MGRSFYKVHISRGYLVGIFFKSLFLTMIAGAVGGYILNFQNLMQYDYPSKEFILSLAGVFFAPLGVITGWIW